MQHFSGTDGAVFEAYRELIEDVASDAFDAEGPFDDHGRVLVTSEALSRVTRSAQGPQCAKVLLRQLQLFPSQ